MFNNPTLADVAKRFDPKGKVDNIVEVLAQSNEILEDMTFIEGNLPTGHKTTIRTGLPATAWRTLNYGVPPSKSETAQIIDTCGMLEAYTEIDKDLVSLNGNAASYRFSEDRAFLEAMNKEMATTLFYGNEKTHPGKFTGFSPRFNELSEDDLLSGSQIIDAGGTGTENTSIYLVVWSPNSVHGIYPKGSAAGFQQHDLGEVTLLDENGGRYQGFRTHYKWDIGLCVRDWRYVVRIANIDTKALSKNAATGADLVDLMIQATELPPSLKIGRPAFYCNKTVGSYLRRQIINKSNVMLSFEQMAEKKVLHFDGIPIRRCDALLSTEPTIIRK